MTLIPLTEKDIKIGTPLPWDLLDVEGNILMEQSRIVDSQPLLDQLFKLGIFRAAPERNAAEEKLAEERFPRSRRFSLLPVIWCNYKRCMPTTPNVIR